MSDDSEKIAIPFDAIEISAYTDALSRASARLRATVYMGPELMNLAEVLDVLRRRLEGKSFASTVKPSHELVMSYVSVLEKAFNDCDDESAQCLVRGLEEEDPTGALTLAVYEELGRRAASTTAKGRWFHSHLGKAVYKALNKV